MVPQTVQSGIVRWIVASPMKTGRRDFLKTGLALAAAAGGLDRLLAADPAPANRPLLVAVRDGTRAAMLDRAMAELGGIGAFVKTGQTVLIKPNIGWDVPPERGANTHPELIARLAVLCREAGAKSVSIFDHTCDQWQRCYATSGIEKAAKESGALLVPGNDESMYREVEIPRGKVLRSTKVHRLVLESDVYFNVPVLKSHSGSLMSAAMKNLMGVVWDRRFYHSNDLHQCIADFCTFKPPTLNLVDAYHPMVRSGPRGRSENDLVEMRSLLASTDIVALDTAAAKMLGQDPSAIRHIPLAAALGVGTMDLEKVDIRRLSLG
jgi:uncharacterized protein (DUF362 family)